MNAPDSTASTSDGTPEDGPRQDCLFCRIVDGSIPSRQVHADEHAVAFLDINGWHRGHTLVIPRRHVDDLVFGPSALPEIAPAIDAVARRLVERLAPDGVNILSSARPAAGQTVFHAHVHVIPRYADAAGFTNLVRPDEVPAAELDAVWHEITGERT